MSEAMREYRRALALHCLSRQSRPINAGDMLEEMGVTAQAELHPEACWRAGDFNARNVAGILRTLEKEGLVRKDGESHNGLYGRPEPLWRIVHEARRYPVPMPPDPEDLEPGGALAAMANIPLDELTTAQLLGRARALESELRDLRETIRVQAMLLDAKEDFLLAHGRYEADLDGLREKWRKRLQREGLLES